MKLTDKLKEERGSAPPRSSTQPRTPTLSAKIETGKVLNPLPESSALSYFRTFSNV